MVKCPRCRLLAILLYRKEGKTYVLDSREVAPGAATEDMFVNASSLEKTFSKLHFSGVSLDQV